MPLSPEAIEAAARGIDPRFLNAPRLESEPLDAELGLRLLCQVETLNPIRWFKGRGAALTVFTAEGANPLKAVSALALLRRRCG